MTANERISLLEKHIERMASIQEQTVNNLNTLSKDIRMLVERDGDLKVLEQKVNRIDVTLNKALSMLLKTTITVLLGIVSTGIAYSFIMFYGK